MKNAWSHNPSLRNNFGAISTILRTEKNKSNMDFGDVISSQMQLYTANLDEKIKEMEVWEFHTHTNIFFQILKTYVVLKKKYN